MDSEFQEECSHGMCDGSGIDYFDDDGDITEVPCLCSKDGCGRDLIDTTEDM